MKLKSWKRLVIKVTSRQTRLVLFFIIKVFSQSFCVLTSFVPVSSQSKLDVEHSKELAKAKYVDQPIYIKKVVLQMRSFDQPFSVVLSFYTMVLVNVLCHFNAATFIKSFHPTSTHC